MLSLLRGVDASNISATVWVVVIILHLFDVIHIYFSSLKMVIALILKSTIVLVIHALQKVVNNLMILLNMNVSEVSDRPLSDFGIRNGSVLKCDDFLQAYNLNVNIIHV